MRQIIGALIIFIAGFAYGNWYSQPTIFQKMIGLHDYMRNPEIRYIWRQTYCASGVADSLKGD